MIISASIMCADLTNLEKECLKLELAGVDRIHFDIMDGCFVPNIVFGFSFIKELKRHSNLPFEVHLMVVEPEKFIDELLGYGIEYICAHLESTKNMDDIIRTIKDKGGKAGIAVKPQTQAEEVLPYLDRVDLVTFMTVEPGFAGQPYKPEVVNKIREIKALINQNGYVVELEADGHMNEETIPEVVRNGVEIVVAGTSSLFKPGLGYKRAVKMMRSWVEEGKAVMA